MSVSTIDYWEEDSDEFYNIDIGNTVSFDNQRDWLNITSNDVYNTMYERLIKAYNIGCDEVLFDNTDIQDYNSGFFISEYDNAYYLDTLVNDAHSFGLEVGAYDIDTYTSESIENLFDFIIQ
jgi:glycerophosphoryl diester phosphodiesterase